jgi:hypothetical protein
MKKNTIAILVLLCLAILSFTACAAEPINETASAATAVTTGEANVTSTAPEAPLDPVSEAKAELESKGWENIQVAEGFLDFRARWGIIIEPTDEEKSLRLTNVIGEIEGKDDCPISAVVIIAFSDDMPMGKRYAIFYVSKAGRPMETYWDDATDQAHIKSQNEILQADDQALWHYMYSH